MKQISDNHPLVSVILPVYNGEKFLATAISSVLSQSYQNWELLVVDDGSTDDTPAICDSFSMMDPRITVFHQENGGVNAARAKGVDNASGEFLTFLDADDTFSSDALDKMSNGFTDDVDLVYCGHEDRRYSRTDFLVALWEGRIRPGICTKMFRSILFKQLDYTLERRLVMGEDLLLNAMYALLIKGAESIAYDGYHINSENNASVTKTFRHNWEYEKYYFSKVDELFLKKSTSLDSYDQIRFLVNKCWLNAMKYVMLDGGVINYKDDAYLDVHQYFIDKQNCLGPSEKLIFHLKNPRLYRMVLKTYMSLLRR